MMETVLTLPIILWLFLVVIGLGHMLYAQMVVVLAADHGGREAAIVCGQEGLYPGQRQDRVSQAVTNVMTGNLKQGGTVAMTSCSPANGSVTVEVNYPYTVIVPGLAPIFPGGSTALNHKTVFRIEHQ